jgi:outer membrane protein OmpA-like peptidoglycan-associated protein
MKKNNFFWVSYSDLMTSMFFVMMVLFFATIIKLRSTIKILEVEKEILENVQKNVEKLKDREDLFEYDYKYKRYTLKFNVEFGNDSCSIYSLPSDTQKKLSETGKELKKIIDNLRELQISDSLYRNVSYMIVVAGSASKTGEEDHNYELSYKRAYNLYKYWRDLGIDFDKDSYHQLVEFEIAGNGMGGVGRHMPEKGKKYSSKNQRFIINIVPKIGSFKDKEI